MSILTISILVGFMIPLLLVLLVAIPQMIANYYHNHHPHNPA